ncbi:hypothetical protein [Streptomyces sp. SGAir0957]
MASDGGTDRGSSAGWGLRDETRKLFKTPTSNLGSNGGSQHPDKRKQGGHGPTLADEVEHLLPTPAARDWKSGESNLMDRNARPLNEVVVNLLPTPTATNPNDGESLESWEARRQRNLAKGINGNGQGTPLAIAVRQMSTPPAPPASAPSPSTPPTGSATDAFTAPTQNSDSPADAPTTAPSAPPKLLPTPMAGDAKGTRNATAGRKRDNPNVNEGWTLSDVVFSGQLLPTPAAADSERTSSTYGRGNPTLTGAITDPPSAAGNESSDGPPPGPLMLWDD